MNYGWHSLLYLCYEMLNIIIIVKHPVFSQVTWPVRTITIPEAEVISYVYEKIRSMDRRFKPQRRTRTITSRWFTAFSMQRWMQQSPRQTTESSRCTTKTPFAPCAAPSKALDKHHDTRSTAVSDRLDDGIQRLPSCSEQQQPEQSSSQCVRVSRRRTGSSRRRNAGQNQWVVGVVWSCYLYRIHHVRNPSMLDVRQRRISNLRRVQPVSETAYDYNDFYQFLFDNIFAFWNNLFAFIKLNWTTVYTRI